MKVKIDFSQADMPNYVEVKSVEEKSIQSLKILREGTGKGNDFLGWIDLPEQIQEADIEKINKVAEKYGGGGHKYACGVRPKSLEEALLVMQDLDKLLEEYNS